MLELALEWVDANAGVELSELARMAEMSIADLNELVEYGALEPLTDCSAPLFFPVDCLSALRTAARLRRDYDMDLFAMAIMLDYLHQIEVLQEQVRLLQASSH